MKKSAYFKEVAANKLKLLFEKRKRNVHSSDPSWPRSVTKHFSFVKKLEFYIAVFVLYLLVCILISISIENKCMRDDYDTITLFWTRYDT